MSARALTARLLRTVPPNLSIADQLRARGIACVGFSIFRPEPRVLVFVKNKAFTVLLSGYEPLDRQIESLAYGLGLSFGLSTKSLFIKKESLEKFAVHFGASWLARGDTKNKIREFFLRNPQDYIDL